MNTIYELSPEHFHRAAPLYAGVVFDQPCYDSIFEGVQEGRVFVDHADAPTAALMCRSYEYYPAGVVSPALRQFIREAPDEADVFASFYRYVPLNEGWKAALMADAPLEVIGRLNFQWQAGTPLPNWRAELPAGGRIVPIDAVLAQQLDRECYPVPFILYDWGSYAAYETHGFGFALLVGDAIASTITAITTSKRHALVNIVTEPPFRRRGCAALVGACFVEACLERGLIPLWDSDDTNIGSIATARRIGFREAPPFVELALPNRAQLERSLQLWSSEPRSAGITMWKRV